MTGVMPEGWQFESSLERDFMELIRFDPDIELYTPQPLTITFADQSGKQRRYTPDGLIQHRSDLALTRSRRPILCEIKHRADFRANWRDLLLKFRAAKAYAAERQWDFRVYTEKEIRTPFLVNARFLHRYLERMDNADIAMEIKNLVDDLRETDADAVLVSLFRDRWNRAAAIPILWHLVATRQIGCDLSEPLSMKSRIWTIRG